MSCHCILQVRERDPFTGSDLILGDILTRSLWENPMHCPTSFHQKCISDTHRSPDKMFSLLQICGEPGNHSCAAAACGGGPNCSGALPLSSSAFRKAEETAVLLTNLTTQLQDPENQVCVSKLHLFSATHGGWETGQSIPGKHRS